MPFAKRRFGDRAATARATSSAVTGQLAGALYGLRGIPETWLSRLAWKDRLLEVGRRLLASIARRR